VLRAGDQVEIDVQGRELRVGLSDEDIAKRLADWQPPAPRYPSGVFAKYAAGVASASEGAITRPT
jgi:dihydroxy-acid dehydratase